MTLKKVLVAGVGNVLRGDDGFGIRALDAIRNGKLAKSPSVRFWESGIAGISLVQELMDRFDALVVLDAIDRGGRPGTLYVEEADLERIRSDKPQGAIDLHETKPQAVLRMAAAVDVLPERVWIVGAQPAECDELIEELSPEVETAVVVACARVEDLLTGYLAEDVSHIDEALQILFWLDGEGLVRRAAATDLERWMSLDAPAIEPVLERMVELGLVEPVEDGRYQLTPRGKREGGRRFADEFSDMTKPGHGECGDPDCDCYTTGDPADCRHNVV